MAGKWHINPTTEKVGVCRASKGVCPFGEENHYISEDRAYESAFEKFPTLRKGLGEAKEAYDTLLEGMSKDTHSHFSQNERVERARPFDALAFAKKMSITMGSATAVGLGAILVAPAAGVAVPALLAAAAVGGVVTAIKTARAVTKNKAYKESHRLRKAEAQAKLDAFNERFKHDGSDSPNVMATAYLNRAFVKYGNQTES